MTISSINTARLAFLTIIITGVMFIIYRHFTPNEPGNIFITGFLYPLLAAIIIGLTTLLGYGILRYDNEEQQQLDPSSDTTK